MASRCKPVAMRRSSDAPRRQKRDGDRDGPVVNERAERQDVLRDHSNIADGLQARRGEGDEISAVFGAVRELPVLAPRSTAGPTKVLGKQSD